MPVLAKSHIGAGKMVVMYPPLIMLIGPTATDKLALVILLTRELIGRGKPAEVVNTDSTLAYRGMDIGTVKSSEVERGGAIHHLIGTLEVIKTASVTDFQIRARAATANLRGQGAVPILVGSSALCMRAITDAFEFLGSNMVLKASLEAKPERVGMKGLYAHPAVLIPESATHIKPGNGRRIARVLKIRALTGGHQAVLPEWTYELGEVHQLGPELNRSELDSRVDTRVEETWRLDIVTEAESLIPRGLRGGRTTSRATGYRRVFAFLGRRCSEGEAKEGVKRATRRFFHKQLGWYRRDPRIMWLTAGDSGNPTRIMKISRIQNC